MKYGVVIATMTCVLISSMVRAQVVSSPDSLSEHFIRQDLKILVIKADSATNIQDRPLQYSENIDELLDAKTGVSTVRRGNYASEVVNRGFSSERMTTSINGMKIHGACTDKMDPVTSYIVANNLKSASVDNGTKASKFGSNTGGQLMMQTEEPVIGRKELFRSMASVGVNSASNGRQATFGTSFSSKSTGINFNGMAVDHDSYKAGGGEKVPFSQYRKYNFSLSVKQRISDRDFLLADYISDVASDVGYPAMPMDVSSATADIYSVTYRKYFTGARSGKLNFKLYGNNITHVMDDSQRDVVMHMDMPGLSNTYGFFLDLDWNEHGRHHYTVLTESYFNRSYAEMTMYPEDEAQMFMLTWPDVHRLTSGIYLSDRYQINEKQILVMSMRYDHTSSEVKDEFGKKQLEVFDVDGDQIFEENLYSFFLNYERKMGKGLLLSLESSYSERLPTVSEQFAYYIFNSQDGFDYIGDPYIRKEKALKLEAGLDLSRKKWSWSTSMFAYHMPDFIAGIIDTDLYAMTIGARGVKRYENLGFGRVYGVESEVSWIATDWMNISTAITYNHGSDQSGQALPLMSPFKNRSTMRLIKGKNVVCLTAIGAMAQNRPSTYMGENESPSYLVWNMDYRRSMEMGAVQLTFFAGIENISDANYWDHLDWNDIPRVGRNFFLKLELGF